ncbi:MAG: nucleotide exchange factor GrpE [Calditrichia bacterium]
MTKNNKKNGQEIPVEYLDQKEQNKSTEENPNLSEQEKIQLQDKAGEGVQEQLDQMQQKYDQLNEQFLRLRSEFANYKRRVEREQLEFSTYLKGELIKKLLPVIDDFDHMLEKSADAQNKESVLEGAKMIYGKLNLILKEMGVQTIESLGEEFNPQIHEAMMIQPTDDESQNNRVVSEFQKGYQLNEKLLRPSKVIVGNYQGDKDQ